ncbi:MAG: hypothetical protein LBP29_09875 [Treponema sp.]|nr:hypothetical protein [Treponema sp.]
MYYQPENDKCNGFFSKKGRFEDPGATVLSETNDIIKTTPLLSEAGTQKSLGAFPVHGKKSYTGNMDLNIEFNQAAFLE